MWLRPSNDHGIKDIHIRTEAPNAVWFDASVDRVADGLGALGDPDSKDVRRARAVGVLARPQQALDLFDATARAATGAAAADTDQQGRVGWQAGDLRAVKERSEGPQATGGQTTPSATGGRVVDPRPPATLYIHLGQDAFSRDEGGVARFEGVGPVTLDQAKKWLGHCEVTVKPVIDLADQAPVDGSAPRQVPAAHEQVGQRTGVGWWAGDFRAVKERSEGPEAADRQTTTARSSGGTGSSAATWFHHRIKTHGRWQVQQPFNGVFVWRSPHGRLFLVDHTGTHRIPPTAA